MPTRLALAALLAVVTPTCVLAQASGGRDNIDALIELHARANHVPAAFVHRVVKRESNYNPRAKGGSALGLMQIKPATARGMGYRGDSGGLFDPDTNLKYGIAYLAGAYRAAKGDLDQAYRYYNRGYYYAAKKLGITTEVAEVPPQPAATSSTGFASLFGFGSNQPPQSAAVDPNAALAGRSTALAYAAPVSGAGVAVPLPPRRPALLARTEAAATAQPASAAAAPAQTTTVAATDVVEVPLPPRRPSAVKLAAVGRPAVVRKPEAPAPVLEATAAPAQ